MKRLLQATAVAVALAAGGTIAPAAANAETAVSVSFQYFHTELAPHGRWFSHPHYGRSWRPYGVAAGWRPYTNGRWVWTADYGWMWTSYYDWGWAPFHYGRWAHDVNYGWFWVPGYTWGPAWVAWRQGDGFIGWYALPPEAAWNPAVGIAYGSTGFYSYSYAPYWVFVPERHFASTRIHSVIVRAGDNRRFFRNTHRKTRYGRVRNHVFNYGIDHGYAARVTGHRFAAVKPQVTSKRGNWHRSGPNCGAVRIFRPPVVERGHSASRHGAGTVRRPHAAAPNARGRTTRWAEPRGEHRSAPQVRRQIERRAAPQPRQQARPRLRQDAQPRVEHRARPRFQPQARPNPGQRRRFQAHQRVQPQYGAQRRAPSRVQRHGPAQVQPRHQARHPNVGRPHRAGRPAQRQRPSQAQQQQRRNATPQEGYDPRQGGGRRGGGHHRGR